MSRDLELDEPWVIPGSREIDDPIEEVTVISAEAARGERSRYRSGTDPAGAEPVAMLRHVANADDLHEQRVNALRTALNAAMDFLTLPKTGAKAWASDLRYGNDVIRHVEEAGDQVMAALNLISSHEDR